jgi:hypothetical protein
VRHFAPSGRVLDPARGQGAFFKALVAYGCLTDWCELEQGRDFLQYQGRVDWVLTNPPWSKFLPFLKHAMRLAPNIVFLASVSHFMFKARLRALEEAGFGLREALLVPSPAQWSMGGFQAAAVWVQKGWTGPFKLTRPDSDGTSKQIKPNSTQHMGRH